MENIQADFAFQQFIDFIGMCVDSDSLPLEMKQQLGNMANDILEHQSENHPRTSGSQAASPSESSVPSCTKNANNEANKDTGSNTIVGAINSDPSVCAPSGKGESASDHEPDVQSSIPTICPDSGAWLGIAGSGSVEESKSTDGLDTDVSTESANGSTATLPSSAVEANEAANLALPQSGEKQIGTANPYSMYSSTQGHLLKAANAQSMKADSQATPFFGTGPLGTVNALSGPGAHVPVMPRAANEEYFLPRVPSTIINGHSRPRHNPSPSQNPHAGQGNSLQDHFHNPMPTLWTVPMQYVGPFGYPDGSYERLALGSSGVVAGPDVSSRVPLGNSRRLNVEAGEGSRAGEAGPQRSSRKKAKDIGSAAAPNKAKPSLQCDLPGCPNPDKEFYSLRELRRHQTTTKAHSRISFPCPTCHKILSRDDARQRHIANVHNN